MTNLHREGDRRQQSSLWGCAIDCFDSCFYANVPTSTQVTDYLNDNPHFLEQYIMNEVELDTVERLMIRKTKRTRRCMTTEPKGFQDAEEVERKTSLSRWKFCVHADKRKMLQELTLSLHKKPTKNHVLWEVSSCISTAVGADGFDLYLPWKGKKFDLVVYVGDEKKPDSEIPVEPVKLGDRPIAQFVAESLEPVRTSYRDVEQGNPNMNNLKGDQVHIMCQPIVGADGQLVGVLEMWRRDLTRPFHDEDEEIAVSYLVWGGVALHYAHMYLNMTKQKNLTDFLLTVVKSIFQDMVSMEMLVKKVMNFAQKLVDADRASLFLVDSRQNELYATIFDVGIGDNEDDIKAEPEPQPSTSEEDPGNDKREIRFPVGTGIAGHVASTGNVLNIRDAYADPRFNRTVDQLTGYKTNTILCMPIYIRGHIIGVVQMVNKRSGYFTNEDVEAFEMFAVYCGLALHHAKLYDKIKRSEQKYKVAIEVLSYHNTCTEKEVEMALQEIVGLELLSQKDLNDYYFSPFELHDYEKANYAIVMFTDLFSLQDFDQLAVVRFTLTVKKNYRRVPYHNWTHGFSVAHCMYSILKKSNKVFKRNESLALFIAALCHDLDHRGKNNKFMLETDSPLAAIYSTSTMEHHHFNQTVAILQQDGHNIFGKLSSQEYKDVLSLVKHCILATDLAMFFPNRKKIEILVKEYDFSLSQTEHRLLLQAIAMTASDLSASAKPWEVQVQTVKVIFEEFYEQGDAEKAAGINPIPMMDRDRPDEQAASQVGFLTGICIPCYSLLHEIIPETEPLLDMCKNNLSRWREIDADPSLRSTVLDDISITSYATDSTSE